jgi:hypothetical protein
MAAKRNARGVAQAFATADIRYVFTTQYLCASAIFARRCKEIENTYQSNPNGNVEVEHRGLVTAAIMQSVAAVEAESAELTMHGPGSHLGSDKLDKNARDILLPLAEFIDDQEALSRFEIILHILGKRPMLKGGQPWQDMAILIRLRNELVHYKSKWGEQMSREKFIGKTLTGLGFAPPPFIHPGSQFFPHRLLGAACAGWAVRTAVAFVNAFYERMEIESRLRSFMPQFAGL